MQVDKHVEQMEELLARMLGNQVELARHQLQQVAEHVLRRDEPCEGLQCVVEVLSDGFLGAEKDSRQNQVVNLLGLQEVLEQILSVHDAALEQSKSV